MFPKCASYDSFQAVTNPYECDIKTARFLGHAGQPVQDILR